MCVREGSGAAGGKGGGRVILLNSTISSTVQKNMAILPGWDAKATF